MPAKNSAGPNPHFTHCRAMRAQEYQNKLKALHANLQTAVQSENYEQAASLRDQITHLEMQLKG